MYVRHLQLGSLPQLGAGRPRAAARGRRCSSGRNGQGKTNLVEAVGYLATLGSHRVSSDAPLVRHGDAAGGRPGGAAPRRPRAAGRDRDQPGPGQPGAGQPRPAAAAARAARRGPHGAVRARGPRPGPGRPGRAAAVPRRAAGHAAPRGWPASGPTTTGCSSSATPCSRPPGWPGARRIETLDVWDGHLTDVGGQLLAARLQLVADLAPHMASAYADVAGDGAAVAGLGYSLDRAAGRRRRRRSRRGRRCRPPPSSTAAMRERVAERRGDELDRGMTLVGPHRDDLVIHLGPGAGQGLRQPRRVLVARAGAEAGHLRAAAGRRRGPDPDPGRRLRHARRRPAGARWPPVARSAEQTLITAAVVEDVPAELRGARVEVVGGTVSATLLVEEEVG